MVIVLTLFRRRSKCCNTVFFPIPMTLINAHTIFIPNVIAPGKIERQSPSHLSIQSDYWKDVNLLVLLLLLLLSSSPSPFFPRLYQSPWHLLVQYDYRIDSEFGLSDSFLRKPWLRPTAPSVRISLLNRSRSCSVVFTSNALAIAAAPSGPIRFPDTMCHSFLMPSQ